jgi:hypothetical protein
MTEPRLALHDGEQLRSPTAIKSAESVTFAMIPHRRFDAVLNKLVPNFAFARREQQW